MTVLDFWISGQPPRKSNQRTIFRHPTTGKPIIAKSQKARAWTESALWQLKETVGTLPQGGVGSAEQPLSVTFVVYYKSKRPDLSIELILDVLQKAGVIKDDRYVYEYRAIKRFSKDDPGVRVIIDTEYKPTEGEA